MLFFFPSECKELDLGTCMSKWTGFVLASVTLLAVKIRFSLFCRYCNLNRIASSQYQNFITASYKTDEQCLLSNMVVIFVVMTDSFGKMKYKNFSSNIWNILLYSKLWILMHKKKKNSQDCFKKNNIPSCRIYYVKKLQEAKFSNFV